MTNLFLSKIKNIARRNDTFAGKNSYPSISDSKGDNVIPPYNFPTQLAKKARVNPSVKRETRSPVNSPSKSRVERRMQGRMQERMHAIEPPRLHSDIKLICDEFGITEQSKYALRKFDATRLEDFSLMTDEDFDDLVRTEAAMGRPLCPLQQRKLRVLLSWARSLANEDNSGEDRIVVPSSCNNDGIEKSDGAAKHANGQNRGKRGGTCMPSDWESRFYSDLPMLKKQLQTLGERQSRSDWVTKIASWIFCDCDK
ncbi:hypothetical protein ACHAXA_005038 [Cyclostephanos tholiformis]|jgi:hypothetical protein|uniref:Uncharacterized protein n=1 Tax=Cyclostephanos tholiformis TaxID=382380 RepID=A0ABD3SRV8_9STRA